VALAFTGAVLTFQSGRARVADRLSAVAGRPGPQIAPGEQSLLRDRGSGGSLLERLLSPGARGEKTRTMLERAGLPLRPGEYLLLRLLTAALGLGAGFVFADIVGAGSLGALFYVAGAFAGYMAPAFYAKRRMAKRAALIEEQLVEMTDLMASSMASGFGYMQALVSIAEQLDPPLSEEITKMVDEVNLGGDIDEALISLAARLDSKDFEIVATAINISRSSGGSLAEILQGTARTIRARHSFKREVRAMTSKERSSAMIISGFPILLAGGLALMAPELYARLFTDFLGRIALGVALTLDAIAYFVIKKMTNIEV
jgi:tight adherence protein B